MTTHDKPASLYEQMTRQTREVLALVLGFKVGPLTQHIDHDTAFAGFRVNLQTIKPLNDGFTIGDAVRAYAKHVMFQTANQAAIFKQNQNPHCVIFETDLPPGAKASGWDSFGEIEQISFADGSIYQH